MTVETRTTFAIAVAIVPIDAWRWIVDPMAVEVLLRLQTCIFFVYDRESGC